MHAHTSTYASKSTHIHILIHACIQTHKQNRKIGNETGKQRLISSVIANSDMQTLSIARHRNKLT